MNIPKPGTYPSTCIREGSRGTNDAAGKHWDGTFGPRICGRCVHFQQDMKEPCPRGRIVQAKDEACFAHFETTTFPADHGEPQE